MAASVRNPSRRIPRPDCCGQQPGNPAKLAKALITISKEEQPPHRFIAGADGIALAEQKVADLQGQIAAYRDLSTSLALDLEPAGGR